MATTASGSRPRWLVVDGDPTFRAAALGGLRLAGYLADGVETADEALHALGAQTYAGGIVDLDLPGAGGLALLRQLRAVAPLTRVIVTTGRYEVDGALQVLGAGAVEVVEKPITDAALRDVAARVLDAAGVRAARPHRTWGHDEGAGALDPSRQRVLVVDDDTLVGKAIATVLRDFDVVFVQSAAGALGRVASGRAFAAIVCDYLMPGMNGIKFHQEIERIDPDLCRRVVFVTGWADSPEFTAFRLRTGCPYLLKPFDPEALLAAVAGVCARDAA